MPKKFAGENSKAVVARERKQEKAATEKAAKAKAAEDALWADDDKNLAKKQARKEAEEKKKADALARKREREMLADVEVKETLANMSKANPVKVTQAKIREEAMKKEEAARRASASNANATKLTHLEKPIEENVNRLEVDGAEARSIEEAISILKVGGNDDQPVDRHPEKRMKAAYEEFEKTRLPQLKTENPHMRLSQLKQLLKKEWQKSPDNPLVKQLAAIRS